MYKARQIAEYILALSDSDIGELTSNLKLQKLLYYAQCVHLAAFGTPLYEEELSAWNYGPVVESVYQDYKIFGDGPILLPYSEEKNVLPKAIKDFICNLYGYFGQYSALKLMQLTHEEAPWKTTKQSTIISKDKMKSFFQTQENIREIAFPTREERLRNAAMLLLTDYENDKELTFLSSIEGDDFYEYETE